MSREDGDSRARRRVVVTGATGTIGSAVAKVLARQGMDVVMVARNSDRLEEVRSQLTAGAHECLAFDVSSETAWADAGSALAPEGELFGLVTAAGRLRPIGPLGTWTIGEFRRTIEVNLIGSVLAVATCAPWLENANGSVVTLSGGGATAPLQRYDAYAASKAAIVRVAENLADELAPRGIRINSVAPGFIVSKMHEETIAAGPARVGEDYFERTRRAIELGESDSPERAADLVTFLLSHEAAGISGRLVSARWDPWDQDDFRALLRSDDAVARVRRIDMHFFAPMAERK